MKKILIVCCLSTICGLAFAKDLNKEQKKMRGDILEFVLEQGFKARVDVDDDVRFVRNGVNYYVEVNEHWEKPYLISFYCIHNYSEELTKENVEKCIDFVSQRSAMKLYCHDQYYTYRTDIFCKDVTGVDIFKKTFGCLLAQIDKAVRDLNMIVDSELLGVDMVNSRDVVLEQALLWNEKKEYEQSVKLLKYLSGNGMPQAHGYLGMAYELGQGVTEDKDMMELYYEKAIQAGEYWCAYRLGNYYHAKRKYTKALDCYMKCAANEGEYRSGAFYAAGCMHEKGEGEGANKEQAIACYRKSVQYATDLDCEARLALMRLGEIVENEEDFVDASKSMLMGLSVGEMYQKGVEYEQGKNGRLVSLPKAYAYIKAAADKGYAKAEKKMGDIYISMYYPFNDKVKSDKFYKKAFRKFSKQAAINGGACYELGCMYQEGCGVEKNQEQAKYYFKSGAELNDKDAAWRIGLIYKDEMEYVDAFDYLKKAAEAGQGMAMCELARCYEKGLGTSYSREKSMEWYKACVEANCEASTDAKKALLALQGADGDDGKE